MAEVSLDPAAGDLSAQAPAAELAAAEPAGAQQPADAQPAASVPEPADPPEAQAQAQAEPEPQAAPKTQPQPKPGTGKPAGRSTVKPPKTPAHIKQRPAAQQLADAKAKLLFDKTLTFSDTNGQGRILIPKARLSFVLCTNCGCC